jgi:uncharacterized membrane protein YeaQ/YmgE (transglycosylase-associated protein family)
MDVMAELELSQTAQQWCNAVLIWIGFGTVAGLLAKTLLPSRQPSSAVLVLTLGILGSVIGPLTLAFLLKERFRNPISPLGLLSAAAGALLLMILYRLLIWPLGRNQDDSEEV